MKQRMSLTARQAPTLLFLSIVTAALLTPSACQAQRNRDNWQRVPEVLTALAINEGSRVADIGAGDGYFTRHLARVVGDAGRVFTVEISQRALSQLRRLATEEGFENIEVIEGETDDPRLPNASLDAVLVVNAYHEMTDYQAMLDGMLAALKPGGRLVMLDRSASEPSESRARQVGRHELDIDLVERELETAGFEILQREARFTSSRNHPQWMLVARRQPD
ncbi:MAG: methyltransferase domain-containing protein [Gemmatimonadales bacterium]|jgi:predicted methyltransferase